MFGLLKQRWAPRICSWVSLDIWHRMLEIELLLPYYHVVSDDQLAHFSWIYKFRSISQFIADVEFFLQSYIPVGLQDIVKHLEGGRRLPKRSFLLTFDDGFREIYDVVAPLLYSKGIPAVFFLTTSVIDNRDMMSPQKKSLLIRSLASIRDSPIKREVSNHLTNSGVEGSDLPSRIRSITYRQRHLLDELGVLLNCDFATYAYSARPYLTSEQIRGLMRRGFIIGAHSVDHPPYSEMSLDEQLLQTRESLGWLSSRYQYDCETFAFPYNDAGVCREFFHTAFSDGHLKVSFGTGGVCPHFFPRNLERLSMEGTDWPAKQILARQFGKAFLGRP